MLVGGWLLVRAGQRETATRTTDRVTDVRAR